MINDLKKLAGYLEQNKKKKLAGEVQQMISKVAQAQPFIRKMPDPTNAPYTRRRDVGDITGEWEMFDEAMNTEEMEPGEMVAQHKPYPELVKAIKDYVKPWGQEVVSIKWHVPGQGDSPFTEEPGDLPYWLVTTKPTDPTELPDTAAWAMWEVRPGDVEWEIAKEIPGRTDVRLYGEW